MCSSSKKLKLLLCQNTISCKIQNHITSFNIAVLKVRRVNHAAAAIDINLSGQNYVLPRPQSFKIKCLHLKFN